ncbi:MAG: hypothetical protein HKN09_05950 [Saprospiraceae bacterium]|nr:hypothetical protein [Saprospiraceae bacterium]
MIGLGIMSGSSLDGLDIALVEFDFDSKNQWQLLHGHTFPLDPQLISKLKSAVHTDPFEYAEIEFGYSKFVVACILEFRSQCGSEDEFIALHGHTVLHLPKYAKSVQMINAAYVAEQCQRRTITDFRNNDLALGGQGTPMAVLADKYLFPGYDYYLNLGGIANISFQNEKWQAFDLFPFNQVLNHFANKLGQEYDQDGVLASEGKTDLTILQKLNSHPYVLLDPPKSLDNTEVKKTWIHWMDQLDVDVPSLLTTFIEFSCFQLDKTVQSNSRIMLTGGGTKNTYFIQCLENILSRKSVNLEIPSDSIIDFKEAILMAFAGALRLNNQTNFISDATGAKRDAFGGAVYLPSTYGEH